MMMDQQAPKTLLMLVKKKWLVEQSSLGSGYLTHLAYQNTDQSHSFS